MELIIKELQAAIKAKYYMANDEHVTECRSIIFKNEAEYLESILNKIQRYNKENSVYIKMLEDHIDTLKKKS